MGAARRGGPDRHRDDPPALSQGRRHDGQGRQQGRAARDRDDQGRGTADRPQGARRRDPGAWRRRRHQGFRSRQGLCEHPHAAPRRRSGRGAQPRHCAPRVRQAQQSGPRHVTSQAARSQDETFTGTKPVEDRHRIDEARLDAWLRAHVAGYQGPLTVLQFKGGQSNPTYKLVTPGAAYVLRRKPFGKLLPSAHAVDREFRIISALYPTGFPVARPYGLCTDDGVIGAAFYVMSMVEGRVFWDATLPLSAPEERRAVYAAEIETLARLHQLDPEALGLGDYGKPGNYFARQ